MSNPKGPWAVVNKQTGEVLGQFAAYRDAVRAAYDAGNGYRVRVAEGKQ